MKKTIILTLLIAAAAPLRAQIPHSQRERIHVAPHTELGYVDTDIFGDPHYRAPRGDYTATLKKDIFDNLTFTDSRRNRIVFDSDYLDREYPGVLDDARAREDFLRDIVARHRRDEGYEATFDIDIFGTVTMRDNRGNSSERRTDIFGNGRYEERRGGETVSIWRDIHGTLQFSGPEGTASLGTAFSLGRWEYRDSRGNEMRFDDRTWNSLVRRHGSEERVLLFLVGEFLADRF